MMASFRITTVILCGIRAKKPLTYLAECAYNFFAYNGFA